ELARNATILKVTPATVVPQSFSGIISPSPVQKWFHSLGLSYPDHFNQAQIFSIPHDLNPLNDIVLFLMNHHDMLRLQVSDSFVIAPQFTSVSHLIQVNDLTKTPIPLVKEYIHEAVRLAQASLNLKAGLVF